MLSKLDWTQFAFERFKPDAWTFAVLRDSRDVHWRRAHLHPFLKWAGVSAASCTRSPRLPFRHWLPLEQERVSVAVLWAVRTYKGSSCLPATSESVRSLPLSTVRTVHRRVRWVFTTFTQTPKWRRSTRWGLARAHLTVNTRRHCTSAANSACER